jgi:hypothetical protein
MYGRPLHCTTLPCNAALLVLLLLVVEPERKIPICAIPELVMLVCEAIHVETEP